MDYSNQVRDSTEETFVIFTFLFCLFFRSHFARAYGLGRASRPASTITESAENRCAQRRHGLEPAPRIPASNSHGRLRSGVDLFGRASRFLFWHQTGPIGTQRDRAGRSNCTESAENRCAQRRHGLERRPRNPASTSHGRRRSGVHLFGRASRGHIAILKIPQP